MPEDLINETSIQVLWGIILLQMAIDLSVRLSGALLCASFHLVNEINKQK